MRGGITQGKRNEADKESAVPAAVRGDAYRGGSVFGRKKRVGAKIPGHQNAAGEMGCKLRKGQGKSG
ncbi:hypothetical protein GCM10007905_29800 [Mixta theicola]|nr:hypothetical protein GCM10007905_29800 [Mixta theicola]